MTPDRVLAAQRCGNLRHVDENICYLSAAFGISVGMLGPHDFAVRGNAFVRMHMHTACCYAHRIPRSTSVTIAIRPSWSRRDGRIRT
jgi:hypothetical protein